MGGVPASFSDAARCSAAHHGCTRRVCRGRAALCAFCINWWHALFRTTRARFLAAAVAECVRHVARLNIPLFLVPASRLKVDGTPCNMGRGRCGGGGAGGTDCMFARAKSRNACPVDCVGRRACSRSHHPGRSSQVQLAPTGAVSVSVSGRGIDFCNGRCGVAHLSLVPSAASSRRQQRRRGAVEPVGARSESDPASMVGHAVTAVRCKHPPQGHRFARAGCCCCVAGPKQRRHGRGD